MAQKLEGKFYPLQHEEWLKACKELTPAEKDVLYFIRTLDPYGDGLDISTTEIAKQLSSETKQVHRSTVSRALKVLDEKKFIDLELIQVKVRVLAKGVHCCVATTDVAATQQARSLRNKRDRHATDVAATQQARSPRNKRKPKALPVKEPELPKTINTYSYFINTLSDDEREAFLEFGRKKAVNLPNPPQLPDKWIAKHYEELYKQFLSSPNGREAKKQAIASQYNWPEDPRYATWLEKAFYEGMPWVEADEIDREQRWAFYQWAQYTEPSPFEGVYI